MFKLIFLGVWACLITLVASYATTYFRSTDTKPAVSSSDATESRQTKEINVPKIYDGVLKGYVVAQLVYIVRSDALKKLSVSPDPFVVDEVFRYLYNDDSIDFSNLRKYDLATFTKMLIKNVNARLKSDLIVDIAVQEFTFLSDSEVKDHL